VGLVHRDIKPGNIFVCRYGLDVDFVKVLDFGLVKPVRTDAASELTEEGFVTGTPSYMAPEIALGHRDIDGRSDIYALGCVGYYLLTGSPLFPVHDRTAMEVLMDQAKTPPLRPSQQAGRSFDRRLEDLLMSCLAKAPKDRPKTAGELDSRLATLGLEARWTHERARRWWNEMAIDNEDAVPTLVKRVG
jgi:serine/threonine-protein kinase